MSQALSKVCGQSLQSDSFSDCVISAARSEYTLSVLSTCAVEVVSLPAHLCTEPHSSPYETGRIQEGRPTKLEFWNPALSGIFQPQKLCHLHQLSLLKSSFDLPVPAAMTNASICPFTCTSSCSVRMVCVHHLIEYLWTSPMVMCTEVS